MTDRSVRSSVTVLAAMLSSCGSPPASAISDRNAAADDNQAAAAFTWPAHLRLLDDGFPKPADPCRRLGESEQTVNYLDDSAQLVGCPGAPSDSASISIVTTLRSRVVGRIGTGRERVTLISVAQDNAN